MWSEHAASEIARARMFSANLFCQTSRYSRSPVGCEGFGRVVVDAGLLQQATLRVQCAGHRVTLVMVDSSVVHRAAKDITHRQSARLLSSAATHVT